MITWIFESQETPSYMETVVHAWMKYQPDFKIALVCIFNVRCVAFRISKPSWWFGTVVWLQNAYVAIEHDTQRDVIDVYDVLAFNDVSSTKDHIPVQSGLDLIKSESESTCSACDVLPFLNYQSTSKQYAGARFRSPPLTSWVYPRWFRWQITVKFLLQESPTLDLIPTTEGSIYLFAVVLVLIWF